MGGKTICILVFLSVLFLEVYSASLNSSRVLVLLDDLNIRHTHSIFFSQLNERGYQLSYFLADDTALALTEYGVYLYDQLILFAPTTEEFGGLIDVPSILDFIDDGHNVIIVGDTGLSDPIREIASECGAQFDEDGSRVFDHLNFDVSDYDSGHDLIVIEPSKQSDQIINNAVILPEATKISPILFKGIGHSIEGSLNFPVLTGSFSSYSSVVGKVVSSDPHIVGKNTVLVSALQARNNARVLIAGSLGLFSDRFYNAKVQKYGSSSAGPSGNQEFFTELSKWVFKERGVLRALNVKHNPKGETNALSLYTIKQEVEYSVDIQEWRGNEWVPYVANDVQLEFIMLDPYVRTFLTANEKGHFSTIFALPDVNGIFTFRVEYNKQGYTSLELIDRVPVRPFRHNEYERFIPTAYPYYAGVFSMLIGLFLFSVFFLYSK